MMGGPMGSRPGFPRGNWRLLRFARIHGIGRIRSVTGIGLVVAAHEAMEPGFGAEMEEQPDLIARGLQVASQLAQRGFVKVKRRLHLDDESVTDDDVEPLDGDGLSFVHDPDGDLPRNPMPSSTELLHERVDVHRFNKPVPQGVVHFVERTDDGAAERFVNQDKVIHHPGYAVLAQHTSSIPRATMIGVARS